MRVLVTLVVALSILGSAPAQTPQEFQLPEPGRFPLPGSNSVSVLTVSNDTLWFGSSRGLNATVDAGASWHRFANTATFNDRGVSAIAVDERSVWVSIGYAERLNGDAVSVGGGLHVSTDRGTTWRFVPQPVDSGTVDTLVYGVNRIRALAVTVPQQNITYDIALTSEAVWIASFAGMLRKSTDGGATWERVILPPDGATDWIAPEDTLDFDLSPSSGALRLRENLNHRVFSVYAADDSTIWVGTAGGINKSTDGGIRWRKYNHQNQERPISGNFVVAINEQRYGSVRRLWAATVNALDPDERSGVSFSEDGGSSWSTTLPGERAHNITFRDSIVYVAANRGLFRSNDGGRSWILSGSVVDPISLQRFVSPVLYAVGVQGDTIWAAGPEGIAFTLDHASSPFGTSWRVFRTYQPTEAGAGIYAYPSPFSPDDEVTRIHFGVPSPSSTVTVRVFDFAMLPVRTLLQNAPRGGPAQYDEIWDGRDDQGRRAANGVYFVRVEVDGGSPSWGKVLLLQ